MHKVLIENAIFYGHHGLFEEETIVGGRFEVNLEMELDFSKAVAADDIDGTINYAAVHELIKAEMAKPSKLIEHLAGRIIKAIKETFPKVKKLKLKISKLNPPISGEVGKVSVLIEE